MLTWVIQTLRVLGSKGKMLVVFDGAYTARPLIVPLNKLGVTVVSRLRSNAKLFDVPAPRQAGQRGRPRKYGKQQVRNVWSNVACWNLNAWLFAFVELEPADQTPKMTALVNELLSLAA